VWREPQTSNFMQLTRVQWGRSSRTDKGVSSLALVISLRMLCPPGAFPDEVDELGEKGGDVFDPAAPMLVSQLLADQINAHLPPEVRGRTSCCLCLPLTHLDTPAAQVLSPSCGMRKLPTERNSSWAPDYH
jgi:hypothetical protein